MKKNGNHSSIRRTRLSPFAVIAIGMVSTLLNACIGGLTIRSPESTRVTTEQTTPFSIAWPFDATSSSSYSFDSTKIDFTGGVCRLTGSDQIDNDSTTSGFGGGSLSGATWDATNSYVRLSQTGSPTNNAELDSSWTPQWSSLMGYWKMNGDWLDSVGSNNGTAMGATFAAGKIGSHSGSFDFVSNQYVTLANDLRPTTAFTLAAWAYPTGRPANAKLISHPYASAGWAPPYIAWSLAADTSSSNGIPKCDFAPGGVLTEVYAVNPLPLNAWSHVVCTYDGSFLRIYVNGVLEGSSAATGAVTYGTSTQVILGARSSVGDEYLMGRQDDVAIWSTALSATEVSTLYQRQSAKYSGTITSRVMDAFQSGMNWTTFSWITTLPFLKPLPDYASGAVQNETSTDYTSLVGSTGTIGDNNLMNGLVGLWHLNESAGTTGANSVNESSGNDKDGTPSGGVAFGSWGALSTSARFDGVDDRIDVPYDASLNPAVATYALWVKSNDSSATPREPFMSRDDVGLAATDLRGITIQASSSNEWLILLGSGSTWTYLFGPPINIGSWTHLAVTISASTAKLYVNGVESVSTAISYVPNSAQPLRMGAGGTEYGLGSAQRYFNGQIDEIAIWSRALHANEIHQLYRRGANRIKYQVRVCTAANCSDDPSGANWKGPDGTNQTYFSELNNNTVALAMTGTVKRGLPSMLFSDFTSPVGTSRYFQYRTILESDDNGTGCNYGSGATWCSPELKSVTVDPIHYDSSSPTVIGHTGISYQSLTTFAETLGASCASGVGYNLGIGASYSSATWYWWNSAANSGAGGWVVANGTAAQSNPAATISTRAASFRSTLGAGTVYFRAFLNSSGTSACELDRLELTGRQ